MTYYESYKKINDIDKLKEKAIDDAKVALFLGNNPDRLKAIEDAVTRRVNELMEESDES